MEATLPAADQERLGQIALISNDLPLQSSTHGIERLAIIPAAIGN